MAAVVAGSVAAGVALAAFNAIDADHGAANAVWDFIKESFAASFFAFPFVAFAGVLIALPIALLLRRLRITSLSAWLLVGFVSGGTVGAAFLPASFYHAPFGFVTCAVSGLAAVAVWWFLAEQRVTNGSEEHD
ncbi:hypothetical protein N6L26_04485 [Qipengyuania sp. SS22]|uniref:hypothetical protein n=1 Tax=Qipengyuania sp. SS22 TaxID=2979461 RepID=UPI0021E5F08F|nr:hypothetical protein [Qipengyuania sp. SS22]UYH55817.1 hypothetical protein N6L26_04485 [Qipengyuania sp. SS22]